jgi:uncharacterized repeat protein (TIGR01451 family)
MRAAHKSRVWRVAAVVVIAIAAVPASTATASGSAPAWRISSVSLPTNFTKADSEQCDPADEVGCDTYVVSVTNVGTADSSGPITITDRLPDGIALVEVAKAKDTEGGSVSCTVGVAASTVRCVDEDTIAPEGVIMITLEVRVTAELGSTESLVTNVAEVDGGGAPIAVTGTPGTVPNTVNSAAPAQFGAQDFSVGVLGADGAPDTQAGGHPATVTTVINYTTLLNNTKSFGFRQNTAFPAVQEPKTEMVDLPLGFVGDPLAAPQCPEADLIRVNNHPGQCPAGSVVGVMALEEGGFAVLQGPIYNVVPEAGYPAMFGFEFNEADVYLRARVLPSADGYVLSLSVPDVQRALPVKISSATLTFFGDPRERDGLAGGEALMTSPAACGPGPLDARLEMDSWVDPKRWVSAETPMYEAGVTNCDALQFEPSITVAPDESVVDTPSGYEVDLKVPQARNVPGLLATPDLKDAVVSLPEGVAISPSAANGLAACTEAGPEGINISRDWAPTGAQPLDPADPEAMEIGPDGLPHIAPGHCPSASQVGEVEILTPVLASPLRGHVYLATPQCGGEGQPACTEASATNGELYGLYLEAEGQSEGHSDGVIIKLKGTVSANPVTGQLTTTFRENPQLPFSELKMWLKGGERASLANPQTCGTFETTSDLTPWSAPATPDAMPFSSYSLSGCPSSMPFAPPFNAESLTAKAAGPSAFSVTFSRHDGEQDLEGASVTMPPGLVGLLAEVPLCGEPLAAAGECPEASKIGTTTVAVGAGPDPFWVSGSVFLTGPFNGAPFGLSVVVPAKAGPFNLGNVVVRAAINVNPDTTAVTVTSGAFPQIVDGVPLRMQTVNVLVNRPGFILNPTNCEQQAVTGKIAAAQGAVSSVSSPFAVEGCKSLAFKPSFTASTQGRASKADGASFDVTVTYPASGQANIRAVKTELPRSLPSRLSTLQKACTAAVFEVNPAQCPAQAVVGIAKASTPVLPVTLTGPVYLVSHGNEKFPNIVVVLQGDGVRVDLVGDTDIKKGITSTTFAKVPDDPVSSFELYLPEGKYSILGTYLPVKANYDLCGRKLAMPTVITGQNGAVIKQVTTIKVTGCPKAKKAAVKKAKRGAKAQKPSHGRGGK